MGCLNVSFEIVFAQKVLLTISTMKVFHMHSPSVNNILTSKLLPLMDILHMSSKVRPYAITFPTALLQADILLTIVRFVFLMEHFYMELEIIFPHELLVAFATVVLLFQMFPPPVSVQIRLPAKLLTTIDLLTSEVPLLEMYCADVSFQIIS